MRLKKFIKILLSTLFFSALMEGYETTISADAAHYDGEWITLQGHITVENAMGVVTAEEATLQKDEEKKTRIDFPWIELKRQVCLTLAEGGVLNCEKVSFDFVKLVSHLEGNPQLTFVDKMGKIYAARAEISYQEIEGTLKPIQVTLFDNVQLIHQNAEVEQPRYALADELRYFPQQQLLILEGKNQRVLFYDQQHEMQLSARAVHAERDRTTGKESIQGVGDVRFLFGPEELEKIKRNFHPEK